MSNKCVVVLITNCSMVKIQSRSTLVRPLPDILISLHAVPLTFLVIALLSTYWPTHQSHAFDCFDDQYKHPRTDMEFIEVCKNPVQIECKVKRKVKFLPHAKVRITPARSGAGEWSWRNDLRRQSLLSFLPCNAQWKVFSGSDSVQVRHRVHQLLLSGMQMIRTGSGAPKRWQSQ